MKNNIFAHLNYIYTTLESLLCLVYLNIGEIIFVVETNVMLPISSSPALKYIGAYMCLEAFTVSNAICPWTH